MATEIKWSDGQAILAESTARWADGGIFHYYYEAEEEPTGIIGSRFFGANIFPIIELFKGATL